MISRLRALVAAAPLAALLVLSASPVASADSGDAFTLDARNSAPGAKVSGPVLSPGALVAGKLYVARVTGTVSLWSAQNFSSRSRFTICGTPDFAPLFAGADGRTGRVGVDAEVRYAFPIPRGVCPSLPVAATSTFKIDTGSGFYDPAPFPGAVNHSYEYGFLGNGRSLAAEFTDVAPRDNYGAFKIELRAGRNSDCVQGGWANFAGVANPEACKAASQVR